MAREGQQKTLSYNDIMQSLYDSRLVDQNGSLIPGTTWDVFIDTQLPVFNNKSLKELLPKIDPPEGNLIAVRDGFYAGAVTGLVFNVLNELGNQSGQNPTEWVVSSHILDRMYAHGAGAAPTPARVEHVRLPQALFTEMNKVRNGAGTDKVAAIKAILDRHHRTNLSSLSGQQGQNLDTAINTWLEAVVHRRSPEQARMEQEGLQAIGSIMWPRAQARDHSPRGDERVPSPARVEHVQLPQALFTEMNKVRNGAGTDKVAAIKAILDHHKGTNLSSLSGEQRQNLDTAINTWLQAVVHRGTPEQPRMEQAGLRVMSSIIQSHAQARDLDPHAVVGLPRPSPEHTPDGRPKPPPGHVRT